MSRNVAAFSCCAKRFQLQKEATVKTLIGKVTVCWETTSMVMKH